VDGGNHGVPVKAPGSGEVIDRFPSQAPGTKVAVTGGERLSANGAEWGANGGELLPAVPADGSFDRFRIHPSAEGTGGGEEEIEEAFN